jgi:hypothetical protein
MRAALYEKQAGGHGRFDSATPPNFSLFLLLVLSHVRSYSTPVRNFGDTSL